MKKTTPTTALADGLAALGIHCAVDANPAACRAVVGGVPTRIVLIKGGIAFRTLVCGEDIVLCTETINAANLRTHFIRYAVEGNRLVASFEANIAGDTATRDDVARAVHVWELLVQDLGDLVSALAATPR